MLSDPDIWRNVTIHWGVSVHYDQATALISRYVITVDPSTPSCLGRCDVLPETSDFLNREYTLMLKLNVSYIITAQTYNCYDRQSGPKSNPFQVTLKST